MKKTVYLSTVVTLMLASCANQDMDILTPEVNDNSGTKEITLSASMEGDSSTRVSFTSGGNFFWTTGDEIAVYNTGNSFSTFTLSSGAGSGSAKFTGELSGSTSTCAVYPASIVKSFDGTTLKVTLPDSYTYTTMPTDFPADGKAAFNSANMPMLATITENGQTNLAFKNLCGLFCFKFNNVPAGTNKIVFTTSKRINGDFSVALNIPTPTIYAEFTSEDAKKTVTVDFTALETAQSVAVYIPVPCGDYNGFTVEMKDVNNKVLQTLLSAKTHKIERCTALRFDDSEFNTYNGHEYVDLGLSVKWATCNVGADKPEGVGNYYSWGETTTKSDYSSSTSTTYSKTIANLQLAGKINDNGILTPAYDAATVNWGGNWRMPTSDEIDELIKNCTWEWTTQEGVNGYKVTSTKSGYEGKSIFLPATGYYNGTSLTLSEKGYYWSATACTFDDGDKFAWRLCFSNSLFHKTNYDSRYYGMPVRPVIK